MADETIEAINIKFKRRSSNSISNQTPTLEGPYCLYRTSTVSIYINLGAALQLVFSGLNLSISERDVVQSWKKIREEISYAGIRNGKQHLYCQGLCRCTHIIEKIPIAWKHFSLYHTKDIVTKIKYK